VLASLAASALSNGPELVRTTLLLALIVLVIGALYVRRVRQRAYRRSHERDGTAQFLASFPGRAYPEALLRQTYAYLLERREAAGDYEGEHFTVAPGHDLRTVYHLDGLDIEDAVLVIADRASARLPKAHDLDEMKGRVSTVQDLVEFLVPYFQDDPAAT
jgi:hypothetical protein